MPLVDATGHSYEWETTVEPTCTTKGTKNAICSVCGAEITETISSLGHNFGDYEVEYEPTCTKEGRKSKPCSRCDQTTGTIFIPATGHNYGEWEPVTEATCQQYGTFQCFCINCGAKNLMSAKGDHKYSIERDAVEATCTTPGSKTLECSECGNTKNETIPATGHDYAEDVTIPTCTEQGYTTYTCECNDTYVDDYVDALGHTEEIIPAVAPTTSSTGLTEGKKCSACDAILVEQQIIPVIEITDVVLVPENDDVLPEGTELGVSILETTEDSIIFDIALENNGTEVQPNGNVTVKIPVPTDMDTNGLSVYRAEEEVTYTNMNAVYENGYMVFTTDHFSIYVLAYEKPECLHKSTAVVNGKAPTCTEPGYNGDVQCIICEEIIESLGEIPATGHNYTAVVTVPTCTEQGYTTYTCECNNSYVDDYVDAPGHSEKTIPAVAPTCKETGLTEGSKCPVCGEILTEQEELPANGHTPADAVREWPANPTCTENGSVYEVVYCSVCDEEISRELIVIEATGHADNDGDGYCDACPELLDPSVDCDHACHSDNFFRSLFWKITRFFNKLFRTNKVCECGVSHY